MYSNIMSKNINTRFLICDEDKLLRRIKCLLCYKTIDCFPNNKVFYVVIKTIKSTLKMYKLNSLINIFLEDISKLILFISSTSIYTKFSFFTCLIDGCTFNNKALFIDHIVKYHESSIINKVFIFGNSLFFIKKSILTKNNYFLADNKRHLASYIVNKFDSLQYNFILLSNKVKVIGKNFQTKMNSDLSSFLYTSLDKLKLNSMEVHSNFKKIFIKNQFDIFLHKNETYISCLKNIYFKNRLEFLTKF
jgi:hypothetical protein